MTTPPPIAEVMLAEAQAITAAAQRLDATHAQRAVDMLMACTGKVLVTGVGKSGLVAQKIAASITSVRSVAIVMLEHDAQLCRLCRRYPALLQPRELLAAVIRAQRSPRTLTLAAISLADV